MRVWNLKSIHGARRTKQSLSYKKFTNLISLAGPIKENNCYVLSVNRIWIQIDRISHSDHNKNPCRYPLPNLSRLQPHKPPTSARGRLLPEGGGRRKASACSQLEWASLLLLSLRNLAGSEFQPAQKLSLIFQ